MDGNIEAPVPGELLIFRATTASGSWRDSIQVDKTVAIDVVGVSVRTRSGLSLGLQAVKGG